MSNKSRAWYSTSFDELSKLSDESMLGHLSSNSGFALLETQRYAWVEQFSVLRETLKGLKGTVHLEYSIPRMGRRIDAVLLIGPVVFVVEFKVGESQFDRASLDQVWDYALDLKNFHEASHDAHIVPVLVATEAETSGTFELHYDEDNLFRPIGTNTEGLRGVIDNALHLISGSSVCVNWLSSPYHPTPTIVEAARSLYAQHSVEDIARFDAGAKNLQTTSQRVEELVDEAMKHQKKIICFVTGVPGAGKTLVGLNVATRHRSETESPTHTVFLSGNGPLVAVLREALTRDEYLRRKEKGEKVRKGIIGERVKAFIQNVHHFRDEALIDEKPPIEHVVIFDEAQRAWTQQQTANFMKRKKNRPGFTMSEPEFLISCMDRHQDWAVVVCLVGGGQEINTGEAGIGAWLEATNKSFSDWHLHISPRLTDSEYAAGDSLKEIQNRPITYLDESLHLNVSMRSFRAENVSTFVKAILDRDKGCAQKILDDINESYPIAITRKLNLAKEWIQSKARGTERYGLMASSKAMRLKPNAIDIRVDVNPIHWFLNDNTDPRSSYYLEDAATEFQVQGLELDWACVAWDGDLRYGKSGWSYHDFRGAKWCNIGKAENKTYLLNAYRVLLTRARQGMVIFVPYGDESDHTRLPEFYDPTFEYLTELGIPVLK